MEHAARGPGLDPERLREMLEEETSQPPPWPPGMAEAVVAQGNTLRRRQMLAQLVVDAAVLVAAFALIAREVLG